MAITYHSGRRIQGTQAEFDGIPAVSGGWKELGRTTLSSAGDNIDVSSLGDKRYYMVLTNSIASGGSTDVAMRLNTDTGSNYASRRSIDGATDETRTSDTLGIINHFENETCLGVHYLANLSSKEKLGLGHFVLQGSAGAGNAARRVENVGKWTNTSNAINAVNLFQNDSGSFDTGSECVVLGYDPDDTHTDNFWEELYSDSQTGQSTDNIDTGTFTNKKYLWVQLWVKGTANTTVKATFNNSTDSTYAYRWSNDGGSDGTATSSANFVLHNTKANDDKFINMFIVNNGTNEILGTAHTVEGDSDGAGTAPQRRETVFKRSTATAITDIEFDNDDTGNFTDWELKVWGSN